MLLLCAALLVAAVCLSAAGVDARSNGQLIASGCDLSPQLGWPNGRFGRNKTGAGNAGITIGVDSGIMRSHATNSSSQRRSRASASRACNHRPCPDGSRKRRRGTEQTAWSSSVCSSWLLLLLLPLLLVRSLCCRWTDAPVSSTFYTIRSGDVGLRSADPTKYTPGVYSEIHIRVQDLKRRSVRRRR